MRPTSKPNVQFVTRSSRTFVDNSGKRYPKLQDFPGACTRGHNCGFRENGAPWLTGATPKPSCCVLNLLMSVSLPMTSSMTGPQPKDGRRRRNQLYCVNGRCDQCKRQGDGRSQRESSESRTRLNDDDCETRRFMQTDARPHKNTARYAERKPKKDTAEYPTSMMLTLSLGDPSHNLVHLVVFICRTLSSSPLEPSHLAFRGFMFGGGVLEASGQGPGLHMPVFITFFGNPL